MHDPSAPTFTLRPPHIQVLLCTLESFHLAPVPGSRGATAIAADASGRFPAQLAVAVKVARGRSRVGVYDVVPGSASASGHGALQKHQVRLMRRSCRQGQLPQPTLAAVL